MHQIVCRLGLRPRPNGGAYSAPPDLVAVFRWLTSKRREGERKRREEEEEMRERGEKEREEEERMGVRPLPWEARRKVGAYGH